MIDTISMSTVNDAWEHWYNALKNQAEEGKSDTSRDGEVVGEIINSITHIKDPTRNIVTSPIRKMPMRYAIGELLWYLSGSNRLSDISKFSSAWDKLSDNGDTLNSAYGHRIFSKFGFDQWEYVRNKLEQDPNSRQAVIHIKEPSWQTTKDTPCTVCLQYFIREEPKPLGKYPEGFDTGPKLYATTYMRSNDIWLGFPYDVFAFTCLQIKLAFELGVGIGTYTHIAGSLHLYERNWVKEIKNNGA